MPLDYHIQDAKTLAEKNAVRELLREAFEVRPGVGDAFAQLYDQVLMTSARSRIAVLEGRVIGHAVLVLRSFALAGLAVKGGIVAMVVVDEAFRGQGIGRALIADLEALAREVGVILLQVAGDPRLYTKFGFIPAYVEARAEMVIGETASGDRLRMATGEDVALLSQWSLADLASGAVMPDEMRWQWVLETKHPKTMLQCNDLLLGCSAQEDACLILDGVGFVRMCWTDNVLMVYEAGCISGSGDRLLQGCLAWGYRNGCRKLLAFLPPRNRFLVAMSQLGALVDVHEDHELHAKVLDVAHVLVQMTDVFAVRLQGGNFNGRLGLSVGQVCVEITVGDGIVVKHVPVVGNVDWHLALSEGAFTRALLGIDLLRDPEEDAILDDLLARLFPQYGAFFWLSDSL